MTRPYGFKYVLFLIQSLWSVDYSCHDTSVWIEVCFISDPIVVDVDLRVKALERTDAEV